MARALPLATAISCLDGQGLRAGLLDRSRRAQSAGSCRIDSARIDASRHERHSSHGLRPWLECPKSDSISRWTYQSSSIESTLKCRLYPSYCHHLEDCPTLCIDELCSTVTILACTSGNRTPRECRARIFRYRSRYSRWCRIHPWIDLRKKSGG